MKDLLSAYYGIYADGSTIWNGMEALKQGNYLYFTISAEHKEIIHMEQAALAYYLYENNCPQVAIPVPNSQGDWFTDYLNKTYCVLRLKNTSSDTGLAQGETLAQFHQLGSRFNYEPQEISSYGQWKQLWIEKLTAFEKQIEVEAAEYPNSYYRLLMDVLPYVIGISENAIQYMQESEHESRFHQVDQGTIAFRRYGGNMRDSVIWTTDLVYDHPARDLAEHIRHKLLLRDNPMQEIREFLDAYQQVRQLSVFSWRLLYARLMYPIHLFDIIERGFSEKEHDKLYQELADKLEMQTIYEKRLSLLFEYAGVDSEGLQIPVLHWI
ncbi:hypothetical protein [Virgibacillus doumboii]|uniref:hypothetical protein n=1 Tax=Virgibacillus doumboii TaxID=2697503 RepID=UPI0013E0DC82|nr:hypothetical protein [Virgibacillus doumboii]